MNIKGGHVRRMGNLWPLLVAGVLAISACAGPGAPSGDTDSLNRDRDAAAASAKVDLEFTVATLDGGTFDGASLAGKPAVLWFWAPWCPTCVAEAPSVKQAATAYEGKVNVVGVAGLDEVSAMQWFVDLTKVDNIEHLADEKGVVWKRFGVSAQSTFVILNASGQIVHKGYLGEGELERRLAELVG